MGLDAMRTGVHIVKGLNFSIKTCYRLVRNHPSILGIILIFYLLYRFLPSVLIFLLHSSPVFICTSILLATLVALGRRDPPKAEEKLQRRYSRRTRIKKDDCVIEEKEITSVRTLGRKMIDIKEDVETANVAVGNKGKARGRRVTFSPIHDYGFISRTIKMDDQPNEIHGMSEIFNRHEKPLIQDVPVADDQDIKEEISKPVNEISDSFSREFLKEHDENVQSSKSVSDHAESSSSSKTTTIATTDPVIDPVPPDSEPTEPVLISINEFDGAPEESNDCSEESETEPEKNGTKAAVSWTDDDEKNLMDLGCSEVERNKRLESLMARRRARKTMRKEAEKNHLANFTYNDAPYQIAPLSIIKNKTFAQPYFENGNGGMQPVPGSAPSVLIPRKNPFDLPYDPHEEKPNLTGDSFSQEFMTVFQKDVYCRHESFCFGSASSLTGGGGGLKQDKGDTRISAFFIPEDIASSSSGQRQLSDTSDSVSSSVPETELQSSIAEQEEEQKQVIEQEGELISNIDPSPHYVEEIIQPPEVDLVDNHHHREQTRDAEINLPNTSEAYINPDVVEDKLSGLNSSSSCSSSSPSSASPSSEMNERFLHEDNTGVVGLPMAVNNSNLKHDVAAVAVDYSIPSAIEKRTIEESLFCVDKGVVHTSLPSLASFPSIASDLQVEVSEVGSPPMSTERTISLTDGECFQYNEGVKSDISSGSEGHWTASSGRCAVDETESKLREVNEISESDVIKASLLRADDESDEPVVIEPAFEQVRIDSNSTSFPMKELTEGRINQIPAASAEPETNVGVCQSDSEEKVDPIASSSSPSQILVERSTFELSPSNGLPDSTSFQMMEPTEERPIDQIPASVAEPEVSLGVGQLDLTEKMDPIASSSSPVQPPPSDGLQHSTSSQTREEDAVNEIPYLGAEAEMNDRALHFENSMVQPPSNDAVQHSTSSQMKEPTEEGSINQMPGSSGEPEMNVGLHQLDLEEKLDPIASSSLPAMHLLENSMVQPASNDAVQHSTSSQTKEPAEGDSVRQIPASNAKPEMNVRDEQLESVEKLGPVPSSSSSAELLGENLKVQLPPDDGLQPSTQIKEPTVEVVISQIPASSGEPETNIEVHQLDSEEKVEPVATSSSPVQLLAEKSTCQQSLNCDVLEVTQTTSMVQPSSNSDIDEVTQVSSEFHLSPRGDLHGERQISSMIPESLNGDVHEVTQVNTTVPHSPNGDIHEERQISSIMHPSPSGDLHEETHVSKMVQPSLNGDLHEETYVSKMVQPSPSADIHEETHVTEMVQPSLNADLHEETQASSMVQATPNVDIHEETHVSEIVQPSPNGDLHEKTLASLTVQPTTNGDCHEATQVNTMVQPSPRGDIHEETKISSTMHPSPDGDLHEEIHIREMVQPSLNGDLHEETQASSMVKPTTNGDIQEETHVSEMVQPSLNGDLHEVTQASSMVQPTNDGDIQEEAHVSEMVQPSLNGDLHEVTQVNMMVQPPPSGDIHEETQVSSVMHPTPHGDLHKETQVSSVTHPTPHGDLHEETHTSEMVQPSLNGDLHEETEASSMVQPTTSVDRHEVTQEPSIMSTEEAGNPILVAHNTEKPKSSIEDVADFSDKSSQDEVTMNLPQTKATDVNVNNVNKPVVVDGEDKPKTLSIEEVSEHGTTVNLPQKLLSEPVVSSDDHPTGIQNQDSEADHVDKEISSSIDRSSSSPKPVQEVLEIPMDSQEELSDAKSPQQQYSTENDGLKSLLNL